MGWWWWWRGIVERKKEKERESYGKRIVWKIKTRRRRRREVRKLGAFPPGRKPAHGEKRRLVPGWSPQLREGIAQSVQAAFLSLFRVTWAAALTQGSRFVS